MKYRYELKVPKDRVAVLIGKNGETKRRLEKLTKTEMEIDSKEGDVIITCNDSLEAYIARLIVKAIARGFNPSVAERLINEEYIMELIDISDYSGKSKKKILRLRGRIIGENGKSRRNIEYVSQTSMLVFS